MTPRIIAPGAASHSDDDSVRGASLGAALAPWSEVARWAAVATLVATVLLSSVAVLAEHDPGNGAVGMASSLLSTRHDFSDVLFVFQRNLLVLGIHLCACWIGSIIARPYTPAPAALGRLRAWHRPLPGWAARLALAYALLVTLLSVAVQAVSLGHDLANLHDATDLSDPQLLWLVLPHAAPELIAVFLPLGLFLIQARRKALDRLGAWSVQAAALAIPLLFLAALIETYVTPARLLAASPFHLASIVLDLRI